MLDESIRVGDVIEIIDESGDVDGTFARTQYVVTGLVRSPYYLMTSNFGSSDLGAGEIDTYVFVGPDAFADDLPYTGAFVTAKGAANELYPSDGYDSIVDALIGATRRHEHGLSRVAPKCGAGQGAGGAR